MQAASALAMLTRRHLNLLGLLCCAGLLGYAWYAQGVLRVEPCPLCIFQRIGVAACGLVFMLAWLHGPKGWGARVYGGLLALAAAPPMGVAVRHLWIQHLPDGAVPSCGAALHFLLQEFRRQIDIIISGAFLFTRSVATAMMDAGNGRSVINILSTVAWQGQLGNISNWTAKNARAIFTRYSTMEQPQHPNLVNCLTPTAQAPSDTATPPPAPDPEATGRAHGNTAPGMVLWGAEDRIVAPAYGRAYAAAIPNAEFKTIAGAGHFPHVERAAEFAQATLNFIKG